MLLMLILLGLSLVFAGWQWLRPYEWGGDPGARFKIVHASVKRDTSYYWLNLYLKHAGGEPHDLAKPVALLLADGREMDPADTLLEGNEDTGTVAIGFRFWLEEKDLAGPLRLRMNDGTLNVRSGSGVPPITGGSTRFFTSRNW